MTITLALKCLCLAFCVWLVLDVIFDISGKVFTKIFGELYEFDVTYWNPMKSHNCSRVYYVKAWSSLGAFVKVLNSYHIDFTLENIINFTIRKVDQC